LAVFLPHGSKVLFLALSVTFLFVFLYVNQMSSELLNRFVPNSDRRCVWSLAGMSLNVKVKGQGHYGQISSPVKMHCNVLAANNVMQQQTGPFCRCQGLMGVHRRCGLYVVW